MNIKEFLIKKDEIEEIVLGIQSSAKYIKAMGNLDIQKIYLEFNTGGLFDDSSPEIKTALKEYLKEILRHFAALLMSSLTKLSWQEIYKDLQLITKGISSIGREREVRDQEVSYYDFYI